MDRSGPVSPQSTTERSALLRLKTDGTEDTPVCPGGPDMISVGPQSTYEQPVLLGLVTDDRGNVPTGPVGHDVIVAERGETVDRPVLVGSHNGTERSVFLGLDVDRVEYVPASTVLVCWSLTSLCHSNGHIETMPAREINPFTALTRIRPQFLRTQ